MNREELETLPHNELVNLLCARDYEKQRLRELLDAQEKELTATKNELFVMRWAIRGIAETKASVNFHINVPMKNDELAYAMKCFGERAAHELLHQARLAFKGHARQYVMRNYILYLQNHASARGVSFRDLGEDNDGRHNIWTDEWEPAHYYGPEIIKRELRPLSIKDYSEPLSNPTPKST